MRSRSFIFWVLLLVDVSPSGYVKTNEEENMQQIEKYSDMNVFVAVGDGVKTLIVMEGDSITLNTSVTEIKRDDTILWMFGDDEYIAKMNEAAGLYFISEGERFRDRLSLDNQTGSLTIKNIRTEHTGYYQLQIRSKSETTKKFSVTVREVISVSLMVGDSVTLQTGVAKIERDDQILWKFGNQGVLIANLNGIIDAKWKNVIKLNDHTGDLTIRNIQFQHSGDYDLEINNSTTILHMKFNIAVSDLPKNNTAMIVIVIVILAVLGILVMILAFVWFAIYKKKASCFHKNGGGQSNQRTDASRQSEEENLKQADGGTDPGNEAMQQLNRDAQ
ncbi:uncharacterized protein LOC125250999 isoform X2 [Megalobrama amblycephala]|uniref:uncharacterized protein LOC125250999 isoform X2 n=1 Tax=Megalobrama amblycephala TaxID=75352 RepID=UPI002013DFEB|nr:uncharacterized protein LOC125250999 isoform X2 [Megalobrama amblycephala]